VHRRQAELRPGFEFGCSLSENVRTIEATVDECRVAQPHHCGLQFGHRDNANVDLAHIRGIIIDNPEKIQPGYRAEFDLFREFSLDRAIEPLTPDAIARILGVQVTAYAQRSTTGKTCLPSFRRTTIVKNRAARAQNDITHELLEARIRLGQGTLEKGRHARGEDRFQDPLGLRIEALFEVGGAQEVRGDDD